MYDPKPLPSKSEIMPIDWTPENLRSFRKKLGVRQDYIAKLFDISPATISHLETSKVKNPMANQMYGLILERIYAYQQGYLPAYRKTGENEFGVVFLVDDIFRKVNE
jgi:transcriptional regulator with XRE-family HTH domain